MKNTELFNEDNRATYCPEDDKLRLYVGRVPRPEYDALRAEGWTSTPKQSEAGQGEFAATWTPARVDTAESYAGIIEDEDAGPAERAADRAERFSGYLGRRLSEATGHGARYDDEPAAHGHQSYARAVKAADRHDRHATRAVDSWDKAEYWQRRTAGVIEHALYKSTPGVRMGRINRLESELRKAEKYLEEYAAKFARWASILNMEPARADIAALRFSEVTDSYSDYTHPRAATLPPSRREKFSLWEMLRDRRDDEPVESRITGHEAAALWLEDCTDPTSDEWQNTGTAQGIRHLELRLAYERQMLEGQGGRAESLDIQIGGTIGGKLVVKANKSAITKRVKSVLLKGQYSPGYGYQKENLHGCTEFSLYKFDTERLSQGIYAEPTPESLAELAAYKATYKALSEALPTAPTLINPTLADAQRLQILINEECARTWKQWHYTEFIPAEVQAIPQAVYTANSTGSYAKAETRGVCALGKLADKESNMWSSARAAEAKRRGPVLCKIRVTGYDPVRVLVITDKPAKPLPPTMWQAYTAPATETESVTA